MSDPEYRFSPAHETALACVLDQIIPPNPDRGMPGAGELGLVAHLARKAQDLAPTIEAGLDALDARAAECGAADFVSLAEADRFSVLNEHAAQDTGFLPGLIFHTYGGYYQHPRVLEALGLPPRAPHPAGYEMEPNDLSLLDPVRQRQGLYREIG